MSAFVVSSPYQCGESPEKDWEVSPEDFAHFRTSSTRAPNSDWGAKRSIASRIRRSFSLLRFAFAIFRLARRERPDYIHAHQTFVEVFACLPAAKLLGIPLIYDVRSAWEMDIKGGGALGQRLQSRVIYLFERISVAFSDYVVAICEGLVDHYVIPQTKCTVIYNTSVGATKKPLLPLTGRLKLIYAGAIVEYEGLDFLLYAIRERSDIELTVIGSGDLARLRLLSQSLGICGWVSILEPVPRAQVKLLMEAADAVILPRLKRPITDVVVGLKPIEALATGTPVVASDVGGHREVLTDGVTAFMFEAENSRSLNYALDKLKTTSYDKLLQMQDEAIEAFNCRFSGESFNQRYRDAYRAAARLSRVRR